MSGKSKHGCTTCRRRRVKCDESMPVCQRCLIAGRRCDGPSKSKFIYVVPNKPHSAPRHHMENSVSLSPFSAIPGLEASEARSFDHFLHRVAPFLGAGLDASLWRVMLPRISHEDRSIRYAVLAISQLYERPPAHAWTPADGQESVHKLSLKWYMRGLADFRSKLVNLESSADYQTALLSCLLFTTIEFQQNNVANACSLLRSGLSIIKDEHRRNIKGSMPPDRTLESVRHIFSRQRVLMAIFGHCPHQDIRDIPTILTHLSHVSLEPLVAAREELFDYLYDTMQLVQAARIAELQQSHSQTDQLSTRQALILNRLEQWHRRFSQMRATNPKDRASQENTTATVLLLYYETARWWACVCLQSDRRTDNYMDHYEKIVTLSERVIHQRRKFASPPASFSFELGTIAPLYMVGWKCRDPALRRKALRLLLQSDGQEALFSAQLHAAALENMIEVEEKRVPDLVTCSRGHHRKLPTPESRVRNATINYETWDGTKVMPALLCDIESYEGENEPTTEPKTIFLHVQH